jgi:hypothetical protein
MMEADALLEAIAAQEPDDKIWQRAIELSEFIQTRYDDVAAATLTAISRARLPDTFAAIATCLLEHLLEHNFSQTFEVATTSYCIRCRCAQNSDRQRTRNIHRGGIRC